MTTRAETLQRLKDIVANINPEIGAPRLRAIAKAIGMDRVLDGTEAQILTFLGVVEQIDNYLATRPKATPAPAPELPVSLVADGVRLRQMAAAVGMNKTAFIKAAESKHWWPTDIEQLRECIDAGAAACGLDPAARGEVLGLPHADFPDDLKTFGERSAYQRGVADARRVDADDNARLKDALAKWDSDCRPQTAPQSTFAQDWAIFEAAGYQYGGGALENVRFGWEIARGRRPAPAGSAYSQLAHELKDVEYRSARDPLLARIKELEEKLQAVNEYPALNLLASMGVPIGTKQPGDDPAQEWVDNKVKAVANIWPVQGTGDFEPARRCPECGCAEQVDGNSHYDLNCGACTVRQAAQEADARGQHIHDLGDDVAAVLTLLEAGEWAEHCTKTPLGQKLEAAITDLHNEIHEARGDTPTAEDDDLIKKIGELESKVRGLEQIRDMGLGKIDWLEKELQSAKRDTERVDFIQQRTLQHKNWGITFAHYPSDGGFTYMHRQYRSAYRLNLREVIDFERGIMPTLPENKENAQ